MKRETERPQFFESSFINFLSFLEHKIIKIILKLSEVMPIFCPFFCTLYHDKNMTKSHILGGKNFSNSLKFLKFPIAEIEICTIFKSAIFMLNPPFNPPFKQIEIE